MAEWLRRLTRNQMGLPAQVQILFAANFFAFIELISIENASVFLLEKIEVVVPSTYYVMLQDYE